MWIVLYDYSDNKIRSKVCKNLKNIGVHAQWSVFETKENLNKIKRILIEEESKNYRVAVFKINSFGKIKKIGKDWQKIKYLF